MTISTVRTDLLQNIGRSWAEYPALQELTKQLQTGSEVKGYTYVHQQLIRHGKLVIGANVALRKKILQLWHDSP